MKPFLFLIYFWGGVLLISCSTPSPDPSPSNTLTVAPSATFLIPTATAISPTISPSPTIEPTDPKAARPCFTAFEQRELSEPYQRQKNGTARYLLSEAEWNGYLEIMGLDLVWIPSELGPPFLNVDWNSAEMPATGRMISIGFENTYPGAGWSAVHILHATYDFAVGSEYDTFVTIADWETVQAGTMSNTIEVGSVTGFVRFKPGLIMEK